MYSWWIFVMTRTWNTRIKNVHSWNVIVYDLSSLCPSWCAFEEFEECVTKGGISRCPAGHCGSWRSWFAQFAALQDLHFANNALQDLHFANNALQDLHYHSSASQSLHFANTTVQVYHHKTCILITPHGNTCIFILYHHYEIAQHCTVLLRSNSQ